MSTPTWILAGQSNMQGYGILPPLADRPRDPRVSSLSSAGEWGVAVDPLHQLWESYTPVHQRIMRQVRDDIDPTATDQQLAEFDEAYGTGAGLGIPFGIELASLSGENVGLIPCAHGGTALDEWAPDPQAGTDSLYGALLDRVNRASSIADIHIAGVLWYQGESDATPELAPTYGDRLATWVRQLRADLHDDSLPFYHVQLGRVVQAVSDQYPTSWDVVRDAQLRLPDTLPHAGVVSAIDLGLDDPIHIATDDLVTLGKRLARLAHTSGRSPRATRVDLVGPRSNRTVLLQVHCSDVNGGWQPHRDVPGFELRNVDNQPHESLIIVGARVSVSNPAVIDLLVVDETDSTGDALTALLDTARVGYGLGLDPTCVLVDGDGFALPAFSPMPIRR